MASSEKDKKSSAFGLSDKAMAEFEVLWRQDHPGEDITREELITMASRVLRVVELIMIDDLKQ